uniref:Uncharacterized protein n=1 Tax=Denticeps clupeoides TaxID=299321 RepID=A0AAY4A4H6_9TELE
MFGKLGETLWICVYGFENTRNSFKKCQPNLSPDEVQALQELKNNTQIVIKPADKGSAIVILDRQQYLWEGYRQLYNTKYYKKLDKPIYLETMPMVKTILQSLYDNNFINAKQMTYLLGNKEPRGRIFHLLPKIHKDPAK